jgi:hypothetical protein
MGVVWGLCFCPSIYADPTLDLPANVATISTSYLPTPAVLPEYILIQDVHHHAEVQGKIATLILYAYEHWGARRVYTEGAFSKVDLTVFHRLPEATRHELLERLVHEGNLSGPELAAVMVGEREWRNPPIWPMQLVGMEDVGLYTANLRVFRDLQRQREGAIREVESLRRLNAALNLPEPNILGSELDRAKSLLELRLTPADYALYLSGRSTLPDSPQLQPMLHEAEKFYELVNERSVAFLKESSRKLPAGNGPRVLIVGGFHTAFMTEQLRQQGSSYIVLSPSITQAGNRKAYEKQLLNSMDTLDCSRLP